MLFWILVQVRFPQIRRASADRPGLMPRGASKWSLNPCLKERTVWPVQSLSAMQLCTLFILCTYLVVRI